METLTRSQLVAAAAELGCEASDRDVQRAITEKRFKPAPEKVADRYAYRPQHVGQLVAFLGSVRRRAPVDKAAS